MSGAAQRIYINGRFLTQPLTGVQRYAFETVRALDAVLARAEGGQPRIIVLTPKGAQDFDGLRHIEVRQAGARAGHAWDQFDLCATAGDGALLSLCSAGPVLHPRHIVVVHDAAVYRMPEMFSFAYRTLHQGLGRLYARTAHVATISDFSRAELQDVLRPRRPVLIAPNAAEHVTRVAASDGAVARLGLAATPFFLGLGSVKKNKNFGVAIEALRLLTDSNVKLVIVGDRDDKVYGASGQAGDPRVIWAGRVSDAEVAGLMQSAAAFVFPSTYEGFGLPPLEAMSYGCPVIASTAPAVKEVCAGAARYFDPASPSALAACMQEALNDSADARGAWIAKGAERARDFSWRNTAEILLDAAKALAPP